MLRTLRQECRVLNDIAGFYRQGLHHLPKNPRDILSLRCSSTFLQMNQYFYDRILNITKQILIY